MRRTAIASVALVTCVLAAVAATVSTPSSQAAPALDPNVSFEAEISQTEKAVLASGPTSQTVEPTSDGSRAPATHATGCGNVQDGWTGFWNGNWGFTELRFLPNGRDVLGVYTKTTGERRVERGTIRARVATGIGGGIDGTYRDRFDTGSLSLHGGSTGFGSSAEGSVTSGGHGAPLANSWSGSWVGGLWGGTNRVGAGRWRTNLGSVRIWHDRRADHRHVSGFYTFDGGGSLQACMEFQGRNLRRLVGTYDDAEGSGTFTIAISKDRKRFSGTRTSDEFPNTVTRWSGVWAGGNVHPAGQYPKPVKGQPKAKPPAQPAAAVWELAKGSPDTSRAAKENCSLDNCLSFRHAGTMSQEGSYEQTHSELTRHGDPSSGKIIDATFTVNFTAPPAVLKSGQRIPLSTSGGARGFVSRGALGVVFFYRASTGAFLEDARDSGPPRGDSPESRLRLDANPSGNVKEASTEPVLLVPNATLGTFTITAVGLNFASITWTYEVKRS